MPINIEDIIGRALESAFSKALEQVVQKKAEALFEKALANGLPFSQKVEEIVNEGFQRLVIRWEKRFSANFVESLQAQG